MRPLLDRLAACIACIAVFCLRCDPPTHTYVTLGNDYPVGSALVVYAADWQAIPFQTPISPGASSDPASTIAASENTAYAVVAPGWDPTSASLPTSFIVLQSRTGYSVHLDNTLRISLSDATFDGSCAAGVPLTQREADFITKLVFPGVFAGLRYDAATCTTTPIVDGVGP